MTRYPTNRERLKETAGELLYREGIRATSVDRLAEEAGLTKPTVYNLFGSKDALIEEALERRARQIRDEIARRMDAVDEPEQKLMEILQTHADMLMSEGFHGCPLVVAAVQTPESGSARTLAAQHKSWLTDQIAQQAKRAGFRSADVLASTLMLILEGAAAMSAVQAPALVLKQARAATKAVIASHKQSGKSSGV